MKETSFAGTNVVIPLPVQVILSVKDFEEYHTRLKEVVIPLPVQVILSQRGAIMLSLGKKSRNPFTGSGHSFPDQKV